MTTVASNRVAVAAGLALVLAAVRLVAADANRAAAEAAFQEAVRLRSDDKWAEACEAFKRSQSLDAQFGTTFNLAGCYEHIGKLVSAWTLYSELAQRDTNAGRKARAASLSAQLKVRLSWLRVEAASKPKDLEVTIDGEPATQLLGIDAPLDVGSHVLVAAAPGHETWTHKITIRREGERASVAIPALLAVSAPSSTASAPSVAAAVRGTVDTKAEPDRPRRLYANLTASLGMYSAPPDASSSPAFAAGAGAAVGIVVLRGGAADVGIGAIANGDVVVDQATFARLFVGAGARVAMGHIAVQAGPGLAVLTGAAETVVGVGGDLVTTYAINNQIGISLHANFSSVSQPLGLAGNLTVLRVGLGVSYLR